ncbi:MAG TPA: hypothetical protein VFH78_07125 [Candidatus Thermoplasmatota archaeon]|nr:hypothetical protein [Candidatus Thermoplasmatota archaeon]
MADDPMTKPRDTSLRPEHIPATTHPTAAKNFEGPGKGTLKEPGKDRPAVAVRQDASLGDTSTRDETRH